MDIEIRANLNLLKYIYINKLKLVPNTKRALRTNIFEFTSQKVLIFGFNIDTGSKKLLLMFFYCVFSFTEMCFIGYGERKSLAKPITSTKIFIGIENGDLIEKLFFEFYKSHDN
jgi:hypothetical protein